jgi:mRNA interferase RelE/StbE
LPYHLGLSSRAGKQFNVLPRNSQERILKKLHDAAENPTHYFRRLTGREESRLRVGDYRIIVEILHDERIIYIHDLGHRKNVYD